MQTEIIKFRPSNETMRFSLDDPEYPEEWQYKDGFPICTAFISAGEKIPCARCTQTIDMFGAAE